MKSIYILLTRTTSVPSRLIGRFTGEPFTHVSLSFDGGLAVLYSFARRYPRLPLPAGLTEERLDRGFYGTQGDIPCALLRLEVPDRVYYRARTKVNHMLQCREDYAYSVLGLLFCSLRIPLEFRDRYFCSQFVGKILADSGALDLPKPASLLHPSDFYTLDRLHILYLGGLHTLRDLTVGTLSA